jgi:hypothetical protein
MLKFTNFVSGRRFPWTTGTATVTVMSTGKAARTFEVRKGYDKRTPLGKGTIQLVTPLLTRWHGTPLERWTGGVGVLRFRFVPEPENWLLLAASLSTLGILYRGRRHR